MGESSSPQPDGLTASIAEQSTLAIKHMQGHHPQLSALAARGQFDQNSNAAAYNPLNEYEGDHDDEHGGEDEDDGDNGDDGDNEEDDEDENQIGDGVEYQPRPATTFSSADPVAVQSAIHKLESMVHQMITDRTLEAAEELAKVEKFKAAAEKAKAKTHRYMAEQSRVQLETARVQLQLQREEQKNLALKIELARLQVYQDTGAMVPY